MAEFFASKDWQTFLDVLPSIPAETWDTFYSTVVATLFALVIGLPLGVLLVTGPMSLLLFALYLMHLFADSLEKAGLGIILLHGGDGLGRSSFRLLFCHFHASFQKFTWSLHAWCAFCRRGNICCAPNGLKCSSYS